MKSSILGAKDPIRDHLKFSMKKQYAHHKSEAKKVRKTYATHDNELSITKMNRASYSTTKMAKIKISDTSCVDKV